MKTARSSQTEGALGSSGSGGAGSGTGSGSVGVFIEARHYVSQAGGPSLPLPRGGVAARGRSAACDPIGTRARSASVAREPPSLRARDRTHSCRELSRASGPGWSCGYRVSLHANALLSENTMPPAFNGAVNRVSTSLGEDPRAHHPGGRAAPLGIPRRSIAHDPPLGGIRVLMSSGLARRTGSTRLGSVP